MPLDDPLADSLRSAVRGAVDRPAGLVDALLAQPGPVPPELAGDEEVRSLLVHWLDLLDRGGVPAVLAAARE